MDTLRSKVRRQRKPRTTSTVTHSVEKDLECAPPCINVSEWITQVAEVEKHDTEHLLPRLQAVSHDTDLSIDDLVYKTPAQVIEEAITKAMANLKNEPIPTEELLATHEKIIPKYDDLIKEREECPLYAVRHKKNLTKDLKVRLPNRIVEENELTNGNDEPVGVFLSDEIVLRVAVYHHRRNIKFQEFLVLGSQPLTALKDVISCESDRDDMIEASNPCLGSFFFIHDTFYVDTRDPRNVDYSDPIIKWIAEGHAANWAKALVQIKRTKMEAVTFRQLNLRIGWRYLYLHRASCEHSIVFSEVRRVHEYDFKGQITFPHSVFFHKLRLRKCSICDLYAARFVTIGDDMAPESPCFFCPFCYHSLHYDANGNLLYQYEMYPYCSE